MNTIFWKEQLDTHSTLMLTFLLKMNWTTLGKKQTLKYWKLGEVIYRRHDNTGMSITQLLWAHRHWIMCENAIWKFLSFLPSPKCMLMLYFPSSSLAPECDYITSLKNLNFCISLKWMNHRFGKCRHNTFQTLTLKVCGNKIQFLI